MAFKVEETFPSTYIQSLSFLCTPCICTAPIDITTITWPGWVTDCKLTAFDAVALTVKLPQLLKTWETVTQEHTDEYRSAKLSMTMSGKLPSPKSNWNWGLDPLAVRYFNSTAWRLVTTNGAKIFSFLLPWKTVTSCKPCTGATTPISVQIFWCENRLDASTQILWLPGATNEKVVEVLVWFPCRICRVLFQNVMPAYQLIKISFAVWFPCFILSKLLTSSVCLLIDSLETALTEVLVLTCFGKVMFNETSSGTAVE